MNIIALISELKWYHDVATTCAADLTRCREQQKSGQQKREREQSDDAKRKSLRLPQRLCASSSFNLYRKSSTL
jgi:hypothetical protein